LENLPRPPYVEAATCRHDTRIVFYAHAQLVGGAASDDVLCVATEGLLGTYCFDTASRAWSKAAGGEALRFAGKVEHDRELGLWLGFLKCNDDDHPRLCATSDLFADVDSLLQFYCSTEYARDDCRPGTNTGLRCPASPRSSASAPAGSVSPSSSRPCGHHAAGVPTRKPTRERFAVFTGVEGGPP
jgi:hypothetical protein